MAFDTAFHDEVDTTAPCHECCSGNDNPCVELLGCAEGVWPWSAMAFTVAGIVDDPDNGFCCQWSPPGFAGCLNADWILPFFSASGCSTEYKLTCHQVISSVPTPTAFANIEVNLSVTVYEDDSPILVELFFACEVFLHDPSTSGVPDAYCIQTRKYNTTIPLDELDCAGPWELSDQGGFPFGTEGTDTIPPEDQSQAMNWPASITVTPTPFSGEMPAECCNFEFVELPGCIPGGVLGGGTDDPTDPTKVIVGCCPGSISKQLSMAIFKTGATCDCLESSDVPLVWTNAHKAWVGAQYACGGVAMWAIWCAGTSFDIGYYWNGTLLFALSSTPGDWECDPFTMDVASLSMVSGMGVPCPSGSTLHLIITDPTPV